MLCSVRCAAETVSSRGSATRAQDRPLVARRGCAFSNVQASLLYGRKRDGGGCSSLLLLWWCMIVMTRIGTSDRSGTSRRPSGQGSVGTHRAAAAAGAIERQ
jgi:hypothetical protein